MLDLPRWARPIEPSVMREREKEVEIERVRILGARELLLYHWLVALHQLDDLDSLLFLVHYVKRQFR